MINLSYPLCNDTPVYGGGTSPDIKFDKNIEEGDSCRTLDLSFSNHAGTHIDLPAHFDLNGKTLTSYSPEFWFCNKIECLFMGTDWSFGPGELITGGQIKDLLKNDTNFNAEAILLKTGFCEKRDSERYWKDPPGIDPNLPDFLRERFPRLRFFGVDLISVSSFANRDAGRLAHGRFLIHSNPILPMEDMNLSCLPEIVSNMLIAPLYLKDADGAPCTVFANIGL